MNKFILPSLALLWLCSCKKSVEYERTLGIRYEVECDSCFVSYKDAHQIDLSQKVYDHWVYSFRATTGDSVCLKAKNTEAGLLEIKVIHIGQETFSDTTNQQYGMLEFKEKFY